MILLFLCVPVFYRFCYVLLCSVVGHVAIVDVTVGILINVLIGV